MKKDKTVTELIERLELSIDFTSVEIVDYWEGDLCTIGLKKENRLVYISTFNYVENEGLICDFDLEIVDENDTERLDVIKVGRAVQEAELVEEIKRFLGM